MGFEKWLLTVIEHSETHIVVNYCRYILQKSRNVMLTSVIVSAAEAYPDKLFEIVCELLRTKELFHLDSHRFTAESSASFLLSGKDLLEKERLAFFQEKAAGRGYFIVSNQRHRSIKRSLRLAEANAVSGD